MIYKIDDIDITAYGATPIVRSGGLAVEGIFDLPKRRGDVEHNWGTSIEPLVDAADIEIDGRTITLSVAIRGYGAELQNRIKNFTDACLSCKWFSTSYDTFEVICRDNIEVRDTLNLTLITVQFWQEIFYLKPLTKTPSHSGKYRIGGFGLQDNFGIVVAERSGESSVAKRIEVPTTEFYQNAQYRENRPLTFACTMLGDSTADLYDKMCQFQALLYKSGLRTLHCLSGNETHAFNVYMKDGFAARTHSDNALTFTLNLIEEK